MSFDSFEEIIQFAIEKEKEAIDFYDSASKQQSYSGAREAFQEFAQEERKHKDMLERLLKGEMKISDYQFKWIPDIKRSNYIVEMTYTSGMPYADMLRLAMKKEEKALQLYNELLKKAEGEDAKNLFKMLCQEEAKHKLKIETLYDDLMAKMGD